MGQRDEKGTSTEVINTLKDVVPFSSLCPIEQSVISSYYMTVLNDNYTKLFQSHN